LGLRVEDDKDVERCDEVGSEEEGRVNEGRQRKGANVNGAAREYFWGTRKRRKRERVRINTLCAEYHIIWNVTKQDIK
jgi:hypothetical protein